MNINIRNIESSIKQNDHYFTIYSKIIFQNDGQYEKMTFLEVKYAQMYI